MHTTTRALALATLTAAVAPAADPAPGKPVDTTFLRQYAETRGFMLGRPQKPKVSPDGKTVLFLRADPKAPKLKLFEFDVATGESKELLSPEALLKGAGENLSPEEKARRERQRVSVGGFTDYHLDRDGKNVLVSLAGKLYVFDRAAGKATELKTGEGGAIVDPKWSPGGKQVAYVRGFDVYVYDLAAGKESVVTTGGTAVKTHGLAEFVAQEEMGRFSGYWWAPDGKHIAYTEADHTGVETWYVADPLKPDQKPAEQFYPRPGKKNVAVRLGIIPVTGGETVWVEWDRAKYEYLAAVQWDKKGGLVVQLQDRSQQTLTLATADPGTGRLTVLARQTDAAWVDIPPGGVLWAGDGFIWMDTDFTRRGAEVQYRHPDGRLFDHPGPSRFSPLDLIAAFPRGDRTAVAYHAAPDPTQKQVRLSVVPPPPPADDQPDPDRPLTTEPGQHTAVFHPAGDGYVVTSTTLARLPRTDVFRADGTKAGELPGVAAEPGFRPNVTVHPPELGSHGSAAVVRPRDFDPKKKYPVVLDVYGGPRHLHVVRAMRNWLVPQWLADQGFVVVAVDNRGTPGRFRAWEKDVYKKFSTVPLDDQVDGLLRLVDKFPELDRDRVGVVGWSFGGYMAANGVLRRPDVFKAAVAGAPVTDWEDYDTHVRSVG